MRFAFRENVPKQEPETSRAEAPSQLVHTHLEGPGAESLDVYKYVMMM